MGRYYKQCGSCIHLNPNDKRNYTYYCDLVKKYRRMEDSCLRTETFFTRCGYEEDKGRDLEALYKMDNPGGCYITTIMCEILGFKDDYKDLQVIRAFRDNVLQKNPSYISILMEYDVIGPVISNYLKNDLNAVNIARTFVRTHIAPVVVFIEAGHFDLAIAKYVEMVNILKNMYGINMEANVADYDYSRGGHGYVLTKEVNKA